LPCSNSELRDHLLRFKRTRPGAPHKQFDLGYSPQIDGRRSGSLWLQYELLWYPHRGPARKSPLEPTFFPAILPAR